MKQVIWDGTSEAYLSIADMIGHAVTKVETGQLHIVAPSCLEVVNVGDIVTVDEGFWYVDETMGGMTQ